MIAFTVKGRPGSARFLVLFAAFSLIAPAVAQELQPDNTSKTSPIARVLDGRAPRDAAELKAMQDQIQKHKTRLFAATVSVQVLSANGSGVIVSKDGIVLTAAHVCSRPGREAIVYLSDRIAQARTLGINQTLDAGMLKIVEPGPWPHVPLGRSKNVELGDWCLAAGYPGGYDQTREPVLRIGRVLSKDRNALLSDCTLSGGDSGGPLLDINGRLIGIHSRIGADLAANLHVPIDRYRQHWARMVDGDAWNFLPGKGPYLGVVRDRSSNRAVVGHVRENSPAARALVQPGDVIVRMADQQVNTFSDLQELVRQQKPGKQVEITVVRDEQRIPLSLIIGDSGD